MISTAAGPSGVQRKEPRFRGPVYVLIDEGSRSTSEVVAGALQYHGLVTVVGERSAGEVLNANLVPLDEGLFLLLPIADFLLPDGWRLEGVGIKPDVRTGADAALQCAVRMAMTGAVNC